MTTTADPETPHTSREILPDLHVIEVPIPDNPLKAVNSYVVTSPDRSLVVDTGMRRPECETVLRSGLEELGTDPGATDLFITHLHADHMGLVSDLATESSTVYFNGAELGLINAVREQSARFFGHLTERARRFGFSGEEIEQAIRRHPGFKYSPPQYPPLSVMEDGDELVVGRYTFRVIATPGHTPGHLCLYEPEHRLLISGDHILGDITPNITEWPGVDDSLGDYLASLEAVARLEVDLCLPGHRRAITDCAGRIAELEDHHRNRLGEVLHILGEGPGTTYHVASRMTWDIVARSWEDFPVVQKWFAVGEAAAHLRHLERNGRITADRSGEAITYRV